MKIWTSFSGDYSGKYKIIATFKSAENAKAAADAFNALLAVQDKKVTMDPEWKRPDLSAELIQVVDKYGLPASLFSESDIAQLKTFSDIQAEGNKITVLFEALNIQVMVKVLVKKGGETQLWDLKDYPEK